MAAARRAFRPLIAHDMSSYIWWVRRSVRNPSSALSTVTVQSSAKAAVYSSYSSSVSSNGSLVGRPLRHALSM